MAENIVSQRYLIHGGIFLHENMAIFSTEIYGSRRCLPLWGYLLRGGARSAEIFLRRRPWVIITGYFCKVDFKIRFLSRRPVVSFNILNPYREQAINNIWSCILTGESNREFCRGDSSQCQCRGRLDQRQCRGWGQILSGTGSHRWPHVGAPNSQPHYSWGIQLFQLLYQHQQAEKQRCQHQLWP